MLVWKAIFITARRYASAVLAVVKCLFVCLSVFVCHTRVRLLQFI